MPVSRAKSGLAARPSPYHPSVTLFEPVVKAEDALLQIKEEDTLVNGPLYRDNTNGGDIDEPGSMSGLRRSPRKRAKVEPKYLDDDGLTDLEDTIPDLSPTKKVRSATSSSMNTRTPKAKKAIFPSDSSPSKSSRKPSKPRSPQKRKPTTMALATPHPTPENWEEVYASIQQMRAKTPAAVDTMGCHMAGGSETDPKNQRFSILVSLMLSPQTKDEVTDAAVRRLRDALGGVLSVDALLAASTSTIQGAINKVGFWNKKTTYIQQSTRILKDQYDGEVPQDIDQLCALPGVGEKIAFLTLLHAWELPIGIGVDTHVHRITNRLGWHNTTNEEKTRLNLQSWLPQDKWTEINNMLVGFGQTICKPIGPRCGDCTLSAKGLCPSANLTRSASPTKGKGKKRKGLMDELFADGNEEVVVGKQEAEAEADVKIALEEMGEEIPE